MTCGALNLERARAHKQIRLLATPSRNRMHRTESADQWPNAEFRSSLARR